MIERIEDLILIRLHNVRGIFDFQKYKENLAFGSPPTCTYHKINRRFEK